MKAPTYQTRFRMFGKLRTFVGNERVTMRLLKSLARGGFSARTEQVGEKAAAGGVRILPSGERLAEIVTIRRRKWRTP